MLQTVRELAEGDETEVTVVSRHINLFTLLNNRLLLQTVGDKVCNGYELEVVLVGYLA